MTMRILRLIGALIVGSIAGVKIASAQGFTPSYDHTISIRFKQPLHGEAIPVDVRLPAYPEMLLRGLANTSVVARFRVHSNGTVDSVEIVKASFRAAANSTAEAIREWKFRPRPVIRPDQVLEVECRIDFSMIDE